MTTVDLVWRREQDAVALLGEAMTGWVWRRELEDAVVALLGEAA